MTTAMRVVKLYEEQAARLELVARVDGDTLTGAAREAIEAHIAQRSSDASFAKRLQALQAEERALCERLSGTS